MQEFTFSKAIITRYAITSKAYRIMKITAVLLTVFCLHVSAGSYSQTITLSVKNSSLENDKEQKYLSKPISDLFT